MTNDLNLFIYLFIILLYKSYSKYKKKIQQFYKNKHTISAVGIWYITCLHDLNSVAFCGFFDLNLFLLSVILWCWNSLPVTSLPVTSFTGKQRNKNTKTTGNFMNNKYVWDILTCGVSLAFFMILRHIRSIVWYRLLSTGNCRLISSELKIGSRYSHCLWTRTHSSSTSYIKKIYF